MNKFTYLLAAGALATCPVYAETTTAMPLYASPASGSTLTELTEIKLTTDVEGVISFDTSFGDAMVKKNGVNFCGIKIPEVKMDGTTPYILVTLKTPATEPGVYTLTIPKWGYAYMYLNESYDPSKEDSSPYRTGEWNTTAVELTYTIERTVTDTSIDFTVDPEEGATVESLDKISFKANPDRHASLELVNPSATFEVLSGTTAVTTATCTGSGLDWEFTLAEPIATRGQYSLEIPAGTFKMTPKEGGAAVVCNENYSISYSVIPPAQDVVYDLEVYGTRPSDDAEWDMDMSTGDLFIYSQAPNLYADPNAVYPKPAHDATVTLASADGKWSQTVPLKYSFAWQMLATFDFKQGPGIAYDGDYVLTVPQGSYGDIDWQEDATKGHANKEYKATFHVTGLGIEGGVVFNVRPEAYSPSDAEVYDLSKVTIMFPEGIEATEGVQATLNSSVVRYSVTAPAVKVSDGVYEFTFDPAPTEMQTYVLTIKKGAFGNADYLADPIYGFASAEIGLAWDLVTPDAKVEFTLEPISYSPSEHNVTDLSEIILEYPEGTEALYSARATLTCKDGEYDKAVRPEDLGDGKFRFAWPALTESGTYVVTIPEGAFGDEIYCWNQNYGIGSRAVELTYYVTLDDSVAGIEAEEGETVVYNLYGQRINAENLPAGIYIINGKKTIIK